MHGSLRADIAAFRSFSPGERVLLLRALAWLLLARLALRLHPAGAVKRAISLRGGGRRDLSPQRAAWAIQAVARRLPGTHCLARSLALQRLVRRSAQRVEIRFGVAKPRGGAVEAHAWVVCDGVALEGGQPLGAYAALAPRGN